MSIFKLPSWVVKAIDHIGRDFLWSGTDIEHLKMRWVSWKRICRPKELGGWGILSLKEFNLALFSKWWWKITSGVQWYGDRIISLNYFRNTPHWKLFGQPPRR